MKARIQYKGKFQVSVKWLEKLKDASFDEALDKAGDEMVAALAAASPVRTGELRDSWKKELVHNASGSAIHITNDAHKDELSRSSMGRGKYASIVYLIENGHGVGKNGKKGYVPPRPFVKEAVADVMSNFKDEVEEMINDV